MATAKYRRVKTPSTHAQSTLVTNMEVFSLNMGRRQRTPGSDRKRCILDVFVYGGGEIALSLFDINHARCSSPPPFPKNVQNTAFPVASGSALVTGRVVNENTSRFVAMVL